MLKASQLDVIPSNMYPQNQYAPNVEDGRKPSKLQMMHVQMQQRHLKEKEEKLLQYRNMNQNNSYLDGADNGFNGGQESGMVRKLFQERREMSDQNGYVPNINQHYKKIKHGTSQYSAEGYAQPINTQHGQVRTYGGLHKQKDTLSRYRPPHLPIKNSAGRDKSNPLAPIERTPKQTPHGSRQSSRRSSAQSSNNKAMTFASKSRFSRSRIQETGRQQHQYDSDAAPAEAGYQSQRGVGRLKKPTNFREWQEKQKRIRDASADQDYDTLPHEPAETPDCEPQSDFERWQIEQNAAREVRLQSHREKTQKHTQKHDSSAMYSNRSQRSQHNASPPKSYMNRTFSPETMREQKLKQKRKVLNGRVNSKKTVFPSSGQDSGSDYDGEENGEIARKQRELEEMIRRQQAELSRIQQEREAEERKERIDREHAQRKQNEQRERQRKQRAAEERRRREQAQREAEEERLARTTARESDQHPVASNRHQRHEYESPKVTGRYEYAESDDEMLQQPPAPFPKKVTRLGAHHKQPRQPAPSRQPPPPTEPHYDEGVTAKPPEFAPAGRQDGSNHPELAPAGRQDGSNFYAAKAQEAGSAAKLNLVPCDSCGRKFNADRLDKHRAVCKQASKKQRKVFDPVKMRTAGTEMAQYQRQARRSSPKPKKNNWRSDHDNFIKTIRYAKAVTEAEKRGSSMSHLPPPPVTNNPDYQECPYCHRTFNPGAAERHIPRCKNTKARPAPLKHKR